jgi:hypothetical protein
MVAAMIFAKPLHEEEFHANPPERKEISDMNCPDYCGFNQAVVTFTFPACSTSSFKPTFVII